jgi:hypothetical protein
MMPRMLRLEASVADILEFVAVLWLNVVLREEYNMGMLYVWYHLIDKSFILIHVGGLSRFRKPGHLGTTFITAKSKVNNVHFLTPPH